MYRRSGVSKQFSVMQLSRHFIKTHFGRDRLMVFRWFILLQTLILYIYSVRGFLRTVESTSKDFSWQSHMREKWWFSFLLETFLGFYVFNLLLLSTRTPVSCALARRERLHYQDIHSPHVSFWMRSTFKCCLEFIFITVHEQAHLTNFFTFVVFNGFQTVFSSLCYRLQNWQLVRITKFVSFFILKCKTLFLDIDTNEVLYVVKFCIRIFKFLF